MGTGIDVATIWLTWTDGIDLTTGIGQRRFSPVVDKKDARSKDSRAEAEAFLDEHRDYLDESLPGYDWSTDLQEHRIPGDTYVIRGDMKARTTLQRFV